MRRGKERERGRERGERSDDSLSCCTEYDDGTVLSFRVVGECLSSYLFISSSVYASAVSLRQSSGSTVHETATERAALSLSMKC